MRLKFILNAPVQLESGGTCIAFVLRDSLLQKRGFPKFADWVKVQWSFVVKSWALAEDAELWSG